MNHAEVQSLDRRFSRGWTVLSLIDLLLLTAGFLLVRHLRDPRYGGIWILKVGTVMVYQQLFLLRNRKRILSGANLDKIWGVANILSLSRGVLIALLAGFLFTQRPSGIVGWLPALLYTTLATLDFFDGYWARRTNTQTTMGELLDQEYDALGILIAVILVIQWDQLPVAFLYVGLAKYVFAWGISWRKSRGQAVYPLPSSYMRRRLAGFQMGILAVFLWPIARPPGTLLAELIIGVPLLLGFIRDWLLVSGALDPEDEGYRKIKGIFYRVGRIWLPVILRGAFAAAMVIIAATAFRPDSFPAAWITAYLPQSGLLTVIYAVARLLLLLVLVAGRFTSTSALLLLLLEGLRIFLSRLDPLGAAIVTATLLLYLFGPGRYRLGVRPPARPTSDPVSS
ncbi:MAG: CDP-alcohol phosphatidyltransferase family protein [Spirochaetaceae bacterium]|nr:MAG: CDP-alcohol phosphatidyltransferase family protein [Spirochaetaceae bacterium]